MALQILIVDDEPIARDILEGYALRIPDVQIVGICKNALEAFGFLNKQPIDVILLDINMPEINGIDFLKTLKNPPNIIFTTAYSSYAVESYEHDAIDYLVKPISFERFLKAIRKTMELIQLSKSTPASGLTTAENGQNIMFVKSEGKLIKVDLSKLWLVEGYKVYVRLWTDNTRILVHTTMKNMEDQLAALPYFLRVNKSYIINMNYITEIEGNMVRLKDQIIAIGNTYKEDVHKIFNSYKLL